MNANDSVLDTRISDDTYRFEYTCPHCWGLRLAILVPLEASISTLQRLEELARRALNVAERP